MKKVMFITLLLVLVSLAFSSDLLRQPQTSPNSFAVDKENTSIGLTRIYATDLFISEYVEGSSYQKALEIFNGTGVPVDLSAYTLKKQTNGAGAFGSDLILSGILEHNDVYVIVNSSTGGTNLVGQPYVDLATLSQVVNFNGNDAVALYHNGVQTDVVGIIDQVANWGIDVTWVRNANIISPTTVFNIGEWTAFPNNTFTNLGSHTFTPTGDPVAVPPTFNPPAGLYSSPISVTLSTTTPGATIYYTTNGDVPTTSSSVYGTPIPVSVITTIKAMAVAAGYINSSVAVATYTFPVTVTNLAALRALPADNTTIYTLSGQAFLTFQQTFRNQKYIQDATAAILIDDQPGIITTVYNVGDGITGISGKLSVFGGMLQFVPTANTGPATSSGNNITPEVITLSQLTTGFENYESELVKVLGVTFVGATGVFANGIIYPINDGSADYSFRTTFYDVDYIGQPVPTVPMDLVGIPNSRATEGNLFTSRSLADIQTPQSNVAAPTFNPAPGVYYNPIQVSLSTTTVGATIYYTRDGTTPTSASTPYTVSFSVNATETVKAIAILNNESSSVSAATYIFPLAVTNLATLRLQTPGTTIYKVTGEIVLTFKQTFRNQKWLQDSSAGIMIDDLNGIITNNYNIGDGIAGICGTLTEFGGMLEFIPTINPPVASSTGNIVTPQLITFAQFTNNFENYESELVLVGPANFDFPPITFTNGTVYQLWQSQPMPNFINFRTTFFDVNYIGTQTPEGSVFVIGIPNSTTSGNYITSRNLADIILTSALDAPTTLSFEILNQNDVVLTWLPAPIPVGPRNERDWTNLTALKVYRNNVLIATITDFTAEQTATYTDVNLPIGTYEYYVTNVYYGLYETASSNHVTVNITANEDEVIVPAQVTALSGNFPNPFNPSTTIGYSVKNPALVNITIYNLKGAKIRTLVSETKANGFYQAVWDGKDESGKAVTSGVYLYRMQADNYVSTKRMMLMK